MYNVSYLLETVQLQSSVFLIYLIRVTFPFRRALESFWTLPALSLLRVANLAWNPDISSGSLERFGQVYGVARTWEVVTLQGGIRLVPHGRLAVVA